MVQTPKFYYFDVGLVNHWLRRPKIEYHTELFGNAFEHVIAMELFAHSHYSGQDYDVNYWRTASGFEVDFVLNEGQVAIEIKGTREVQSHHLNGLRAFAEEYKPKKAL